MNYKQYKAIQDIIAIKEKDTTEVFSGFKPTRFTLENRRANYLRALEYDKQLQEQKKDKGK